MKNKYGLYLLLCVSSSFALDEGPYQPDYLEFEEADMQDMVDLKTGNFSYQVPLGDIPSPYGSYPLSLSYHAGITPSQEATWVGLGWSLNPGGISRAVRGVPDDLFNGSVIAFSNIVSDNNAWMFGIGYSRGNIKVGQRFYSNGKVSYSFTAGYAINDKLSVGYTLGTEGQGYSLTNADGRGFDVWQSSSGETTYLGADFGNSCYGGTQCGVGLTVSGDDVSFSAKSGYASIRAGNKGVMLSVGNAKFDYSNTSSKGESSFRKADVHVDVVTQYGTFSGDYQQTHSRFVSKSATSESHFGYIYQAGPAINVASENSTNESVQGALLGKIESYRDVYEKGSRLESVYGSNLLPAYDLYSVSAEGLAGSFRPFARENHSIHQEIRDVDHNKYGEVYYPMYPSELNSPFGERKLESDENYDSEYKDYSYCIKENAVTEDAKNACSIYGKYKSEYYNEGNRLVFNSKDPDLEERGGIRFLFLDNGGYYESVENAKGMSRKNVSSELLRRNVDDFDYALYGSRKIKPLFENDNPTGKLTGFEILASNGTKYIYKQPIKSYLQVDYTINSALGGPIVIDGVESYPNHEKDLTYQVINFLSGGAYEDLDEFGIINLLSGDASKILNTNRQAIVDFVNFLPTFVESNIIPSSIVSTFTKSVTESLFGKNEMEDVCSDQGAKNIRSSYKIDANAYATQWLLSEIQGSDYVDFPSDTSAFGGIGYRVRFTYTAPSLYYWRTPYAKPGLEYSDLPNYRMLRNANVPEGCDPRMFSASFGVKENVYLSKIETATHEVVFTLNDKERVDGKGWDYSDGVNTPIYFKGNIAFDLEDESLGQAKEDDRFKMKPKYLYLNTPLPEYMKSASSLNPINLIEIDNNNRGACIKCILIDGKKFDIKGFSKISQLTLDKDSLEIPMKSSEYKYGSYKYRLKGDKCSEKEECFITVGASSLSEDVSPKELVVGLDGDFKRNIFFNLVDYIMTSPKMSLFDNQTRYLEKISYYNKNDLDSPYQEYFFNYDYSLQPKSINSYCSGRYPQDIQSILESPDSVGVGICDTDTSNHLFGKLTLKSIVEKGCVNGYCVQLPPFKFGYNSPNASAFRYGDQNSWKAFVAGSSVDAGNVESVTPESSTAENETIDWGAFKDGIDNALSKLPELVGPEAGKGFYETIGLFDGITNSPRIAKYKESSAEYKGFGYGDALDDVDASFMSTGDAVDEYGFWSYTGSPDNHTVNQEFADYGAAAWSLNKVTDPAGGVVEIEYERDDYRDVDYYGDNYNLFPIKGFKNCDDKLCIELQPLYWIESCNGTERSYWSTEKPKDADESKGYEYLKLLKQDGNDHLMYSLNSRMRTEEWKCGHKVAQFLGNTCHAYRNVAVIGDAKTSFNLETSGNKTFIKTDRNYDEILSGLDRAARKYAPDTNFKSEGDRHEGYIWLRKNFDVFKGGDIRVSRITKHDVNYKTAMQYKYAVGEIAQLVDSTFNPVLVNRFSQNMESYVLPDMYLKPKSRIVGINDDDLNMIPGSQVMYPQITIQNTLQDDESIKNGKKEFYFISPEKGVPAEFVDDDLRNVLKPFIALNLKYYNLEHENNDSLLRGCYFDVSLLNKSGYVVGKSIKTVLFDGVNKTLYFYLDSADIKNISHAMVTSYKDDFEYSQNSTVLLDSISFFNEYQISVALERSSGKKANLSVLWSRHQEPGYFPIQYKHVDYARIKETFVEAVTRGPIILAHAKKEKLINLGSTLVSGSEELGQALLEYFGDDETRKMPSAFNKIDVDFESKVTYHDLTSFVGQPYKVVEYRGSGDNMVVIRVDSTILNTRVPDVLENVISGNVSNPENKLGIKREKWISDRKMGCDSIDCIMKNYELYMNPNHRSLISYEHVQYPAFCIGSKSFIGFDASSSRQNEKNTYREIDVSNYRFDPVSGTPTASMTSAMVNKDSLVRKLTQKTPHYMINGNSDISNRMFLKNMLDQNYLEEVYFDTVHANSSEKLNWKSIKEKSGKPYYENLVEYSISPFRQLPHISPLDSQVYAKSIVAMGTYTSKDLLTKIRPDALKYQEVSNDFGFPSLQEYAGKHINTINEKYKVSEMTDVYGQVLATEYSSDGMFQLSLAYPARLEEIGVIVPYQGKYHVSQLCSIDEKSASCKADGNSVVEYRLCDDSNCETKREENLSGSFVLDISGKTLNYLRVYPKNAEAKTYIYDSYGRMIQSVSEDNLSSFYEYDGLGNLIQVRNDDGVSFKSHHREYMNDK